MLSRKKEDTNVESSLACLYFLYIFDLFCLFVLILLCNYIVKPSQILFRSLNFLFEVET